MNKVILKGRLTKDVTTSFGSGENQTLFARWVLAVEDRGWKIDEGKYHTDFIPCFAVGKTAEIAQANLCKGKEILLYGKMQSGSYEKEGTRIYTLQMMVEEIEFCGKKSDTPMNDSFMNIPDIPDEELPFK